MQSGELIVTGKGFLNIPLDRLPAETKAWFKDEESHVPCNPHTDSLEYSVHHSNTHHHHKFVLIIKWNVSGHREIRWEAFY